MTTTPQPDPPAMPSGPSSVQNPALIADAMPRLIQAIGSIMLMRVNDPTYIVPAGIFTLIHAETSAIGDWSMSVAGVSAVCTLSDIGPDTPQLVTLTMTVYDQTWVYEITG